MTTLFCAIIGVRGSAFAIDIDTKKSVDHLKKAMKTENPRKIACDASDLQLFLAVSEDGKWLASSSDDVIELKKGKKTSRVIELTNKDRELQGENSIGNLLAGMDPPETCQIHVLLIVPELFAAVGNKKKRNRTDEGALDAWMTAIETEQVTALPLTCKDLREYLQRPLGIKIPIYERYYQEIFLNKKIEKCAHAFDKLFESEPREQVGDENIKIVGNFMDSCSYRSRTKATYHYIWDSLIATLMRRVTNGSYIRNANASTSTGLTRPDLCFYYGNSNICVFRGEEEESGTLEVPIKKLYKHLVWRYDNAPYIFGYAAVGLQVCLLVIRKDERTERAKVEIVETYNLSDLNSRLLFFLALLNLSTLFRPVVNLIQPLNIRDYGTIEQGNGVQISFAENCVVKTYPLDMPSDSIIRNLKELHCQMQKRSVPNVVQLRAENMEKRHVMLCPVGQLAAPENVRQLLTALRDILKALVALHAINIMHRDLRWENVLKYQDEDDKWFLIDFDDGALSPAAKVEHLEAESHAPEILSCSSHTVKVDIWGVGYLIKTSNIFDLPAKLEAIKEECLQESPMERPTAVSLFEAIEELLRAA